MMRNETSGDRLSRRTFARRTLRVVTFGSLIVVVSPSCSQGSGTVQNEENRDDVAAVTSVAPATRTTSDTSLPFKKPAAPERLSEEFATFVSPIDATVGIVAVPVGGDGPVVSLGEWREGAAWSTAKVPLVLAGLDEDPEHRVTAAMELAITKSDNVAADEVWRSLGAPEEAAAKMDKVLRDFGDPTDVESRRLRGPRYSAFGQTIWSLVNQARFLAALACSQRAAPVLDLMRQVEPGQQWGLGAIAGTKFKGGWGPSSDETHYLVRQIGLIPKGSGLVAVATAADVDSRTYEGAIPVANALSGWLSAHLADFPAGSCPLGKAG